jgi:molybdate transport system regulatory protein
MASKRPKAVLKLKAQVMLDGAIAIGPGKADLLEAVARTGSIAGGGRALGHRYRRTRDIIHTLPAGGRLPLVDTATGGRGGGGTTLTPAGREVLKRYRALQVAIGQAADSHAGELLALAGSTAADL